MEKVSWKMIRQFNKGKTKVEGVKAKEKIRFYSPLPINGQCLVISQEAGFQQSYRLLWKTNIIIKNSLHTPLFPPLASSFLFFAGQTIYGMKYPLWSVGVSYPGCVLSQGFAHPQPTGQGVLGRQHRCCAGACLS